MASQAWSFLALVLLFTTINESSAARQLLDTTNAAPEATPTAIPKPSIPAIPTGLPPMPSITIPKVTIPTTIPTTLPPMPSIPTTIPETIPTVIPTALPPMLAIPNTIPTSIPKVPGLQMPPIPFMAQPPTTSSP